MNNNSGRLEMIIGCMYSSKSSTIISRIRQHKILGKNIIVVNHKSDDRYTSKSICSHDNVIIEAHMCDKLSEVLEMKDYLNAHTIFIEEAQFFNDLYDIVYHIIENDNKHVILCGLDGDFQRQPFQQVLNLIPLADIVERKNALCIVCRDGTMASFSKRIGNEEERNIIGGIDKYMPVCRYHYNN